MMAASLNHSALVGNHDIIRIEAVLRQPILRQRAQHSTHAIRAALSIAI